ncbi:HCP-like protein [Amylostereum chailletii]|nr:HCP-like protein [Amylostereum chailletii]
MVRTRQDHKRARKASWLAFGLVALAAASNAAKDTGSPNRVDFGTEMTPTGSLSYASTATTSMPDSSRSTDGSDPNLDTASEAARAYKHALATLSTLTALSPSHSPEPIRPGQPSWFSSNSILSSILPNPQGHGPFATALRIAYKLQNQSWLPRFLTSRVTQDGFGGRRRRDEDLRGRAIKTLDLLHHAAELGHDDALFTLAKLSLMPPTQHFVADPALAYKLFTAHALETGNATSQSVLAFLHATGYHNVVPVDQAKAQLYYTFAAHGGDKGAQMALGYRYWSGIGVAESCDHAVQWYEAAAEQAMAKFLSGPRGGRTLPLTPSRLSDLDGGVYGPGASVASTGFNILRPAIKAARARLAGETWEDILEYYVFNADRGETDFAFRLGKIYYAGSIYHAPGGIASGGDGVGRVVQDFERARYYFLGIARQVWPSDPVDPLSWPAAGRRDDASGPVGYSAPAAGYLGRMYLRGEGVRQDARMARMWFERGAEYGDKECNNGLGIIWRDRLVDNKIDMKKALHYFNLAAGQELAEAQVNLGKYYYEKGDLKLATAYFEAAQRHGSPFEAYYYLGRIHSNQRKTAPPGLRASACSVAASFFKVVAERGSWDWDPLREGDAAWETGTDAGREQAMLKWWIAAERGQEIAQNNLAYVLDQDKSILRNTRFTPFLPSNDTARLALTQWTRSAAQHNVDALVKVGDYYYHGLGVPDEEESLRWEKAAGYYQSAADTQLSALAMWSLGWMYENGLGVPQDFHLAKRHYDIALETNPEAYLPVMLSLLRLYARSIWHTILGGTGGLSLTSEEDYNEAYASLYGEAPPRGELDDGGKGGQGGAEEYSDGNGEDGAWYMGKAREQFNTRMRGDALSDDDDPVQWAHDRRQAELDRDGDMGPEDFFDASLRGGNRERGEDESEFTETMLLVGLCLVVSVLLYVRGRWVERLRREEAARQEGNGVAGAGAGVQVNAAVGQQGEGQGLFPLAGDPARDEWAIQR